MHSLPRAAQGLTTAVLMDDYYNLCHGVWECKYGAIFIPKYRKTALYDEIRNAGEPCAAEGTS